MAKILITGGSGFIGSHLAAALVAEKHQVRCLIRPSSSRQRLEPLDVCLAHGDITDCESLRAAVEGCEIVFQLAGCLRALDVRQFFDVNEQGVRNVAAVCAEQARPPVLVVVSSLAAAGPAQHGRPRVEADPPQPVSNYGRSKLAGEQAVREFADRLPISIVRPPIVFGEGDPATREIFEPIARFGVHMAPRWGTTWISVVHADDLVRLLLLAAERGKRIVPGPHDARAAAEGCYFAAAEPSVTYAEFGRMIGRAMGRRRTHIFRAGPIATWSVACVTTACAWLRRRPYYFDFDKAREALAGSWTCSAAAARRELGFAPGASLLERIEQTARWYRERGWL